MIMKKAFLIMSFQYAVNVIGLPLYIDFWEHKIFFSTKTKRKGKNMKSVKVIS